jgi:acyl carrier protein
VNVRDEVRTYLSGELKKDLAGIRDEESLLESGTLDSVGVMALVAFIEGRYGFKVADEDMMPEHFDSLDAIAAFVEAQRGASRA